jgi:antitoxin VapB
MATARVFTSGHSQAVRLPKEFRFQTKVVEIFRRGDEVVLREKPRGMARAYELLRELPEDLGDLILPDGPPQKRKGL